MIAKIRVSMNIKEKSMNTEFRSASWGKEEIFTKTLIKRITRIKETIVERVVSLKTRELRTARK